MKKVIAIGMLLGAAGVALTLQGCMCERGSSWNPTDGYQSGGSCYVPCVPGIGTCSQDPDPEDNGQGQGGGFENGGGNK